MKIFLVNFVVFLTMALALGIGLIFRGKPVSTGCHKLPDGSSCKNKSLCHGVCRRAR